MPSLRLRARHYRSGERIDVLCREGVMAAVGPPGSEHADLEADWIAPGLFDLGSQRRVFGRLNFRQPAGQNREGAAASLEGAVSDDGRFVAFASGASNLVTGDANGQTDVFVRDRVLGTTRRVSLGLNGADADGSSRSVHPRISIITRGPASWQASSAPLP